MNEGIDHLDGLTVVEDARFVAGPFCGQVLRWLGASVIKLAPSPAGGSTSFEDPAVDDAVRTFVDAGKSFETADSLESLLERADVLVTDRTASQLHEVGLDPSSLLERYPGLVVVSVTGYGLTGPHADWPASELTTYHVGGEGYFLPAEPVYSLFPDRPPVRGGRGLADYDAGLCAALGAVAALVQRERTGRGDLVEVSAQEVELGLNRTTLSRCFHERADADRAYQGYDYAGTLACSDGYLCIRPVEDRQWRAFVARVGRPELGDDPRCATRAARFEHRLFVTEELERWTRSHTRAEARVALIESGCPGGPFLEPSEVLRDETLAARGVFVEAHGVRVPHRLFTGSVVPCGEAPAAIATYEPGRPLAGVRVLDFTWVAAGPYAAELLAFMGAEVIKVESPDRPDLFRRRQDGSPDLNSSIRFVDINQGKLSVRADLKDDADRSKLEAIAAVSDVVIDNFRPGVRSRLGLSDDRLRRNNPRLVSVGISGFGHDGPEVDRPGYASVFNAESGIAAMTGYPDAPPADVRDSNDLRIGMVSCLAAVTGLLGVARRGVATSFFVAGREALVALQGDVFVEASRGGEPTRSGNALGRLCPYGVFPAAGDWVAVSVRNAAEWRAFVRLVGGAIVDPELADLDARWSRRSEIEAALVAWLADRPASESVEILAAGGVPAGMSSPASVLRRDPHLNARGFFRHVPYPALGDLMLLGAPLRFGPGSERPDVMAPPKLGEHDELVYGRRDPVGAAR